MARIWSHEETGNGLTYARDLAVARWARENGIEWRETPSGGVVRRLRSRDGWSRRWEARVAEPASEPVTALRPVLIDPGQLFTGPQLGLAPDRRIFAQLGGESAAHATLDTFLSERGHRYHREMSSPVSAFESCSRLSPHLAYGTISTRQIVQRLRRVANDSEDKEIRQALRAFDARLHWRDHFMQKLEDEPAVEFHNFVRGFDGLRENDHNAEHFAAWQQGRTGYPMVDACMRCLRETGWINFRMLAMLMSFAARISPMAALAPGGPRVGKVLCRLRTRHPLEPMPNAIGDNRHQYHTNLQSAEAAARSRSKGHLHPSVVARIAG